MSSAALEVRLQQLSKGPRALWAPPLLAVAAVGHPQVLYVGKTPPMAFTSALARSGYRYRVVSAFTGAKRALRTMHFSLVVVEPDVQGVDMVDWVLALKAGHDHASGVPFAVQALTFLLVDAWDDVVALGRPGEIYEAPRGSLPRLALALLAKQELD